MTFIMAIIIPRAIEIDHYWPAYALYDKNVGNFYSFRGCEMCAFIILATMMGMVFCYPCIFWYSHTHNKGEKGTLRSEDIQFILYVGSLGTLLGDVKRIDAGMARNSLFPFCSFGPPQIKI